jgi:alanyl-tRNA synthetase
MPDSNSIRRTFSGFFEERGHIVVPSSSLIPVDPTLLLTNAGMVQFKPYFLGDEQPPFARATSIQKCGRTSDIDIVGTTDRHLTFFEMLGNFSFGDYFKEEAISWGYELVTEGFGLDPELLWFTVYKDDDEAADIWIDGVGVPPERVQRGDKDNFWQMGIPGPCGPAAEIFYDRGAEKGDDGGPIGGGEDRFVEIWNLVFMQNIQDEPYHVVGDLPKKSIDTGAGLERLNMVMNGKDSVFETDAVLPILAAGAAATKQVYGRDARTDVSLRILADHGRSMTLLIGDGVVPSNDGRGYILRRLIRRAVRHAWQLGCEEILTPSLVDATVEVMAEAYPDLVADRDFIAEVTEREEFGFRRTLETGYAMLDDTLADASEISGPVAFKLHDTYGFPIELTTEIAAEREATVDRAGFDAEMEEQRKRSRAVTFGEDDFQAAEVVRKVVDSSGLTDFVGYELESSPARVLAIIREGELVEQAEAGQEIELFLDRTPFYAEGGGQVGDTGEIKTETGSLQVIDTQAPIPGLHGHAAKVTSGTIAVGQDAEADIDHDRREKIRKSHTGTHILHASLRDVIGEHARQNGSLVEAGRLRFDFSHHAALEPDELTEVERLSNERIIENARVRTVETSKEDAEKMGAVAFFGDKYGTDVRVVSAGGYSMEFCGGTHTYTTGQVGPLIIAAESSIGANIRRFEAFTGTSAYLHLVELRDTLRASAGLLKSSPGELPGAIEGLKGRLAQQESRIEEFEQRERSEASGALAEAAEPVGDVMVLAATVPNTNPDGLRLLALQLRDRLGRSIVSLGTNRDGKASLVTVLSKDLVAEGKSAADVVSAGASIVKGGGGKDPELSMAGGSGGDDVPEAVEAMGRRSREVLA